MMKEESIRQTAVSIAYITQQLGTVQVVDHRTALISLLSTQEQRRMMSQVGLPFAAMLFDPPSASSAPTSPRVTRTLLVAVASGIVFGLLAVALLYSAAGYFRERRAGAVPVGN
jgi:uncharacterized protein involved in exopolysaccharide biosynthesis